MTTQGIKSVAEYRLLVTLEGKFKRGPAYVPYYWDLSTMGGPDEFDNDAMVFVVQPEDRKLFPELATKPRVTILELNDGFIVEV